ncbi:hypothetical protein, partial [Mycobacterium avium]
NLCRSCPALTACTAWVASLPPRKQPPGVRRRTAQHPDTTTTTKGDHRMTTSADGSASTAPHQTPSPPTDEQALAALQAAALGLLLAGLANDGRLATEVERMIAAGAKVTAGVLGFMTAAAANGYEYEHGSREAAIDAVSADLAAVLLTAGEKS